ncbi:MAG: hypothetical protein BGO98_49330 [Myxococcales bacterium 68-20]|nr:hypothetical protein [Myxococcales bacterium]OJY29823.1 MAG: hypothetical protein BGO98_49330 [Myxococcales bacterium 68-20]
MESKRRSIFYLVLLSGCGLLGACGSCVESSPSASERETREEPGRPVLVRNPDGGRATNINRVLPQLVFDAAASNESP